MWPDRMVTWTGKRWEREEKEREEKGRVGNKVVGMRKREGWDGIKIKWHAWMTNSTPSVRCIPEAIDEWSSTADKWSAFCLSELTALMSAPEHNKTIPLWKSSFIRRFYFLLRFFLNVWLITWMSLREQVKRSSDNSYVLACTFTSSTIIRSSSYSFLFQTLTNGTKTWFQLVSDGRTNQWTNERTDGRKDISSYSDARTHLKRVSLTAREAQKRYGPIIIFR